MKLSISRFVNGQAPFSAMNRFANVGSIIFKYTFDKLPIHTK
jgi:hypothetical protein